MTDPLDVPFGAACVTCRGKVVSRNCDGGGGSRRELGVARWAAGTATKRAYLPAHRTVLLAQQAISGPRDTLQVLATTMRLVCYVFERDMVLDNDLLVL